MGKRKKGEERSEKKEKEKGKKKKPFQKKKRKGESSAMNHDIVDSEEGGRKRHCD